MGAKTIVRRGVRSSPWGKYCDLFAERSRAKAVPYQRHRRDPLAAPPRPTRFAQGQRGGRFSMNAATPSKVSGAIMLQAIVRPASS